jgi:hypothetical protein
MQPIDISDRLDLGSHALGKRFPSGLFLSILDSSISPSVIPSFSVGSPLANPSDISKHTFEFSIYSKFPAEEVEHVPEISLKVEAPVRVIRANPLRPVNEQNAQLGSDENIVLAKVSVYDACFKIGLSDVLDDLI